MRSLKTGLRIGHRGRRGRIVAPYLGVTATRCRIPTSRATANKQFTARSYHVARDNIINPQIIFANWCWNRKSGNAEQNAGGNSTIKCAIEYPEGVMTRIYFGGAESGTMASGAEIVGTCAVTIPNGAEFWVRTYFVGVTATVYIEGDASPNSPQGYRAKGEVMEFNFGGVTPDKSMSGVIADSLNEERGITYGPVAIVSMTTKPSVFIVGDSRAWGWTDAFSGAGDIGDVPRAVGPHFGYINTGTPGASIGGYTGSGGAKRRALSQYCSHIIIQAGANDMWTGQNNQTAEVALTRLNTLIAELPADKPKFTCTSGPFTTSSDLWATTAGQTLAASKSRVDTFNAAVRAGIAGTVGFFELADQMESARNSGKWKVNGSAKWFTPDGIHAGPVGYAQIAASGAISPARITR